MVTWPVLLHAVLPTGDCGPPTCIGRWNDDSKTRGRSNWVGTKSFGRLGRPGLEVLKHLQYHRAGSLSNLQRNALRFSSKSDSQHAAAENQSGPCPRNSTRQLFQMLNTSQVLEDGRDLVGFCSEWETHHHWGRPLIWNSASLKSGRSVRNRFSMWKQWPL